MFKKIIILSLFIINASIVCSYAEENTLSLNQCISLAEKQSELIRIQLEKQRQIQESIIQARGGILPEIKFEYSKFYRDTTAPSSSGEGADSKFSLSQPLFYGFRKSLAVSLAKNEKQKQELELLDIKRGLKFEVAKIFYTVAQAEADLNNVRNTSILMQQWTKDLNERVRLGKSRESEVLVAESRIADLLAQEEKIKGDRAKAIEQLSFLTGIQSSKIKINDNITSTEKTESLDKILSTVSDRSDLQVLKKDVESQMYRVRIAKGTFLPTLDLDSSYYTARSGSLQGVDWDVLFSFDFPLFSGGITRSKLKEELSKLKESELKVELLTRQITSEVRNLYNALVSSMSQAQAFKSSQTKAEKSYQMQLKDYRFGMVNNLDVIQATIAMLDAKRNFDRMLIQVKMDRVILYISTEQTIE